MKMITYKYLKIYYHKKAGQFQKSVLLNGNQIQLIENNIA